MEGTVSFVKNSWGFVRTSDNRHEYFWHRSNSGGLILQPGDRVIFKLAPSPRHGKVQAINIQITERTPLGEVRQ